MGRTDIDHGRSWPEGHTDCDNLCCLCRRHHRLKTHARGWRFVLLPGGELQVTTPSGISRTTTPPQEPPETPVPSGAPPGIGEPLTTGPGDPGFIGPWPF
ncbi:MAG TPA: HNH endonuclease signature motif containing protein [Geodermatophilus sp.]|nr:HNH endonuclease signature motif containing protein [Geodermatophilus sp.]